MTLEQQILAEQIRIEQGRIANMQSQPQGAIQEPQAKEPQVKGFIDRVNERRKERTSEVAQTFTDYSKGNLSGAELALQTAGKGAAGMTMDVIGEGLVSAGRGASAIIPDAIEEPVKEFASDSFNSLMQSDIGKKAYEAVSYGSEAWKWFKEENPRAAKDVESVVNIGLLFTPAKTRATAKPTIIGKARTKVGKAAGKQIRDNRNTFIKDLVLPKKTPTVLKSEVARTTEKGSGIFKTSVVKPTTRESKIIDEVLKIHGVTVKKSAQQNYTAINKTNIKLAKKLERDVLKSRASITVAESSQAIDDAVKVIIDESPIIVGNLKTTALRVSNKAKKILAEHSETPLGLLKARKDFDNWVRTLPRGEAKLSADAAMEAQSVAIKTTRSAMNDLLNNKVRSTVVKRELSRQSLLYEALENVTPKAAEAANTAVGRAWQNTFKVLGIRNKAIQSAAAVMGVGGLGAAAQFAPIFTTGLAVAGAGTIAGKLLLSPKSKIFFGKFLKVLDEALLTSKNPSMIKQLRADRVLVIELMENSESTETNEE